MMNFILLKWKKLALYPGKWNSGSITWHTVAAFAFSTKKLLQKCWKFLPIRWYETWHPVSFRQITCNRHTEHDAIIFARLTEWFSPERAMMVCVRGKKGSEIQASSVMNCRFCACMHTKTSYMDCLLANNMITYWVVRCAQAHAMMT